MVTGDDLPRELATQILEYVVVQKDGSPLAPLTAVCKLWNQILEPYLFAEVTFRLTNASILSGDITPDTLANTIRGSRLLCLKKLRLVIDVDLSSFTTIVDYPRRRMRLGADFTDVMDGFFDTMAGWGRDASFDLDIHEEQSCGHHLNHLGSKLAQGNLQTVHCVRSIRHLEFNCDRCRCCSYRGLLSYLCSAMKGSDHLKEISYGYQERIGRNRSIQYERWDFLPPTVESLTVRDMDEQGYWYRPSTVFRTSLLSARHQLRTFRCSKAIDASLLKGPRLVLLRWPFLQHLSMTFFGLGLAVEDHADMMMNMAKVARGMPEIKQFELWFRGQDAGARNAGHFCYTVDNKKAHAVWSMNREFDISEIIENEWDITARQHTSRGLTTEFRSTDLAPGDVIQALPPAREEAAFFSERSYAADRSQKQKFEISYEHRFEYRHEYEIWGGDKFHRWEEDDNYPWSGDKSEDSYSSSGDESEDN
ncbi:hypothetical protein CGLO_12152 [Colletotrichum gloeosporioides Cg-14]|uniref:Uncharacterized protein n=1 Tax=Colletotrichum gloeosporioides (strain Cg-14) TaxID=1237896 RepID=T0JZD2_COLGC|nr:hypothetical protein CGLO_12152 [Colletotrichum gloeosporioides Cg-14]